VAYEERRKAVRRLRRVDVEIMIADLIAGMEGEPMVGILNIPTVAFDSNFI
jgi:hypothetical protein